MQSADQSAPFLELAPELRLLIYNHVWPGTDDGQFSDAPNSNVRRSNIAAESALLRVCRTTCIEASPIFFTKNAFVATISSDNWHWLPSWLQSIGPKHTSLIPSLTIEWRFSQRTLDWIDTHHTKICHWAEDEPSCQKPTASLPILTSPDVGFALALATAYPTITTDLHEYTQLELTNIRAAIQLAIALKNIHGLRVDRIYIPEYCPPFNSVMGSGCMEEIKIIRDICVTSQCVFYHKVGDGIMEKETEGKEKNT